MSTSNPSAAQQSRRAQADEVKDLKHKYSELEPTVQGLRDDLDKVLRENRTLQRDAAKMRSEYEDMSGQLKKIVAEQGALRKFQTRATKLLVALSSGHNIDKLRSDILAAALASGDPNAHLQALVDDDQDPEQDDSPDDPPEDDVGHTTGAEQAQEELRDRPLMLTVVAKSLFRLYGATTGLKPDQMRYPYGLVPEDPGWPSIGEGNARVAYLRFDWTKKHDDPVNIQEFNRWCQYVRTRGPELVPDARDVLVRASDDTIQSRCIIKYNYEAEKYRRFLKDQNANPDGQNEAGEVEAGANNSPSKKQTLAYTRSRGEGKLKVRRRKLESMTNATYTEIEKNTFLTPGAQSADEEEWTVDENGRSKKTPNVYVTRPWSFLSERFISMKTDVDSHVDPDPPRGYVTRKPGPPREGPPPNNLANQFLLREWMVDAAVLAANPEWKRTRRVIPDDAPITSDSPLRQKGKRSEHTGSSAPTASIKKAKQDLHRAKVTHDTDLGGQSLEQLRDALTNDLAESNQDDMEEEGDGDFEGGGDGSQWGGE